MAALTLLFVSGASADTVEKTFSLTTPSLGVGVESPTTGFVEQFDSSLGTLTKVEITYDLSVVSANTISNSSDDNATVQIVLGGSFKVEMPSGTEVLNVGLSHTTDPHEVDAHQSGVDTTTYTFDGNENSYTSDLIGFIGNGNWSYVLNQVLSSTSLTPVTTGVSISNSVTTASLTNGTVTYTYTAVPEPTTWALLGICGLVLVLTRKRNKA